MSYCPNCGRPLQDGEICNCKQKESAGLPVGAQGQNAPVPADQSGRTQVVSGQENQPPAVNTQNSQVAPSDNRFSEPSAPFNQYNASGHVLYNTNPGGNPYKNHPDPPSYYQQAPYDNEREHLKRFMSSAQFIAARDVMCSVPVLFYAITVTALVLFDFIVLQSFLHPIYILLVIASWITYASALKSKRSDNLLPSTAGLSIASGIAVAMLVIWSIGFGLIILVFALGIIGTLSSGRIGGSEFADLGIVPLAVITVIFILTLILGIKYYSVQSRNIKGIRYLLTTENTPRKFSIFPSVIQLIAIILVIISLIYATNLVNNKDVIDYLQKFLLEYFRSSGIDKMNEGFSQKLTDMVMDTVFSKDAVRNTIISGALYILNLFSLAIFHISVKARLRDFTKVAG